MSGWLVIVGLGPGDAALRTPQADAVLDQATDIVGYAPYVDRVAERPGQVRHLSDNGAELFRARQALDLAQRGRRVAVVSSGDAGVFGMASTVFEAIEAGDPAWRTLDIRVVPGISAVFAAAARIGAPLGHDFCVISLSDNLKSWATVCGRVTAAVRGGFVLAFYNPASRGRVDQVKKVFSLLRDLLPGDTPVVFASAVSRPDERLVFASLATADAAGADMRTLVLVGTAATRRIDRPGLAPWIYAPRRGE
jgi:precorrin-3B C17-methyltransferase